MPVALGCGIGVYFALRREPELTDYVCISFSVLVLSGAALRAPEAMRPLALGLALSLAGILLAGARAEFVRAPVLGFMYYGPIEGRIVKIDRSASDKVRLTLDQVVLFRVVPEKTPERVRISLHGEGGLSTLIPGMTIATTGHLSAPRGPVEPGGFDFARKAWFDRLGAVGYTRVPVVLIARAEHGLGLFVARMRQRASAALQSRMPGSTGPFAAAILTGDRSEIAEETLETLRASNLAHLLAISGLHMGLLTGVVFALVRTGCALAPQVALRVPTKKIAAVVALAAGFVYLLLSGANVATERAFVMVSVVLTAVLLERRALTLRAVAIAALIVMLMRPESLLGPGFQMSFAATLALVAVFAVLRQPAAPTRPRLWRWASALFISSAVAGAATAPFGAAHFNQIAQYGLLANLISVPVMASFVMPAAVFACVLAPIGLEAAGLWVMHLGISWILGAAAFVSGLEGSVTAVVAPGPAVLPLVAAGGLLLALIQGRVRLLGLAPLAVALVIWSQTERPDVLISDTGGLLGVMTDGGRTLSRAKGDGFVAEIWLENDGDQADQAAAAGRREGAGEALYLAETGGVAIGLLRGKRAVAEGARACAVADLLIVSSVEVEEIPCAVIGPRDLFDTGALALWVEGKDLRVVAAQERIGQRPWATSKRPGDGAALVASRLRRAP